VFILPATATNYASPVGHPAPATNLFSADVSYSIAQVPIAASIAAPTACNISCTYCIETAAHLTANVGALAQLLP
jgi:sulfatase maturation enzyme AslB (radical SAM superfamily)